MTPMQRQASLRRKKAGKRQKRVQAERPAAELAAQANLLMTALRMQAKRLRKDLRKRRAHLGNLRLKMKAAGKLQKKAARMMPLRRSSRKKRGRKTAPMAPIRLLRKDPRLMNQRKSLRKDLKLRIRARMSLRTKARRKMGLTA